MPEDEKPQKPSDTFTHPPLPYVVTLRTAADDDSPARTVDYHLMAYGVMEAILQAIFQAGGSGLEGEKHKVEKVEPDMKEYARLFQIGVGEVLASMRKPKAAGGHS